MQKLTILNSRELKQLRQQLEQQFGYFPEEELVFLRSEKDRIFIINKSLANIDWNKLIVDKVGLYFGEQQENRVRLSKEGAQLLGLWAGKSKKELKNVILLKEEEVRDYFHGKDLEKDLGLENRLVLLEYKPDILGCAQYKDGKILNFMPKISRGEVIL